jgi:hypothetical protein
MLLVRCYILHLYCNDHSLYNVLNTLWFQLSNVSHHKEGNLQKFYLPILIGIPQQKIIKINTGKIRNLGCRWLWKILIHHAIVLSQLQYYSVYVRFGRLRRSKTRNAGLTKCSRGPRPMVWSYILFKLSSKLSLPVNVSWLKNGKYRPSRVCFRSVKDIVSTTKLLLEVLPV